VTNPLSRLPRCPVYLRYSDKGHIGILPFLVCLARTDVSFEYSSVPDFPVDCEFLVRPSAISLAPRHCPVYLSVLALFKNESAYLAE
jgi:hypothetical protein